MDTTDLVLAILDFVEQGKLTPIEHGYCGVCGEEKRVYEPSADYPPQMPTCMECLVQVSLNAG